jgi:hypothetical protein
MVSRGYERIEMMIMIRRQLIEAHEEQCIKLILKYLRSLPLERVY